MWNYNMMAVWNTNSDLIRIRSHYHATRVQYAFIEVTRNVLLCIISFVALETNTGVAQLEIKVVLVR
jgi:hypothetical protein